MKNHEQERDAMETRKVEKAWISYTEAQRYAGIGRTKLWQLVSSRKIRAAKVGRSVRINRESLEQFLEHSTYTETK